MEKAQHAIAGFMKLNATLGVICMGGILILNILDITLRTFFLTTIVGVHEIIINLMAALVFLGLGWCALTGGHISVDVLAKVVERRKSLDTVLNSVNNIIALFLAVLISWQSLATAIYMYERSITTWLLSIPFYPFYILTAYGFFLLAVAVLILQVNVRDKNKISELVQSKKIADIDSINPLN